MLISKISSDPRVTASLSYAAVLYEGSFNAPQEPREPGNRRLRASTECSPNISDIRAFNRFSVVTCISHPPSSIHEGSQVNHVYDNDDLHQEEQRIESETNNGFVEFPTHFRWLYVDA